MIRARERTRGERLRPPRCTEIAARCTGSAAVRPPHLSHPQGRSAPPPGCRSGLQKGRSSWKRGPGAACTEARPT
ncbi:hypothetical protein EVAR_92189_1 [Eumeta japonica]|uniref:Uncharacterized protein n=1 Tax=Eumeta variegata TaxID=151549 RepID=A0A4C2AAX4_EUMVA|nr:hypothetical protein EVAR_92189_1 [Eumeta japonica]